MNAIIKVDGDRAKADWNLWCPYTSRKHNDTRWIAGKHEDDYVKVDGEWNFQHPRAIIRLHAPHEKGETNN